MLRVYPLSHVAPGRRRTMMMMGWKRELTRRTCYVGRNVTGFRVVVGDFFYREKDKEDACRVEKVVARSCDARVAMFGHRLLATSRRNVGAMPEHVRGRPRTSKRRPVCRRRWRCKPDESSPPSTFSNLTEPSAGASSDQDQGRRDVLNIDDSLYTSRLEAYLLNSMKFPPASKITS